MYLDTVHIWTQSSTENTSSTSTFLTHCDFDIRSRSHKITWKWGVQYEFNNIFLKNQKIRDVVHVVIEKEKKTILLLAFFIYFYFNVCFWSCFAIYGITGGHTNDRSPLHRLTCIFRMSRERDYTRTNKRGLRFRKQPSPTSDQTVLTFQHEFKLQFHPLLK